MERISGHNAISAGRRRPQLQNDGLVFWLLGESMWLYIAVSLCMFQQYRSGLHLIVAVGVGVGLYQGEKSIHSAKIES